MQPTLKNHQTMIFNGNPIIPPHPKPPPAHGMTKVNEGPFLGIADNDHRWVSRWFYGAPGLSSLAESFGMLSTQSFLLSLAPASTKYFSIVPSSPHPYLHAPTLPSRTCIRSCLCKSHTVLMARMYYPLMQSHIMVFYKFTRPPLVQNPINDILVPLSFWFIKKLINSRFLQRGNHRRANLWGMLPREPMILPYLTFLPSPIRHQAPLWITSLPFRILLHA